MISGDTEQALRNSLMNYAPDSTTASDYNNFVNELLKEEA